MHNKIIYLMSGRPHLPYLLTSLRTLRQSGNGFPVEVHAWEESFPMVEQIAYDTILNVVARKRTPKYRGKNDQFLDKIDLVREQKPYCRVLYLDADTTIHGSLLPLFNALEGSELVLTQFCDWVTNTGVIANRVHRLLGFMEDERRRIAVEALLQHPFPSPNGGIWAANSGSFLLDLWYDKTNAINDKMFIADEVVLHELMVDWAASIEVFFNGVFNCSPKYQPKSLKDEDVVVRHYHGDSNVRPDKSQRGWDLWRPIWYECLEANIGNVRDWIEPVVQENKWMRQLPEVQPR